MAVLKPEHFLLTTLGSLGDLHPYIAVGLGLRARGHVVTIATSEIYRAKITGEGLNFAPVRPDLSHVLENPEIMRRAVHPLTGTQYVVRQLFLPFLEQSFEDTLEAARDADLIVGHPIAFTASTVAEHLRKPWVSIALQPSLFLSAHDPPVVSGAPLITALFSLGPGFTRFFFQFVRKAAGRWGAPLNVLRARHGLPAIRQPVLFQMFSPWGTQAWFSNVLAQPQSDWPVRTSITGFPFYDKLTPGETLSPDLARFLDAGPAPIVFTLGSSAVFDAGRFYAESLAAALKLGSRAVLLIGRDSRNAPLSPVPDTIFVAEYAPYSELLSRAAATVHQGGVGTTAQALRSGRPMIVVPYSHDQPDNGRRIQRLGVGRVIPRRHYRAIRVANELQALLENQACASAGRHVADRMAAEDGVTAACEGLEEILERSTTARP
jgi:UDP:flavonoid glycosyltransferase YjiC (YdhE family)